MSGARERFVIAVDRCSPDLLRYFSRRGGPDAADLVSETVAIAWRQHRRLPPDSTEARMWLFGIARNVLRNAQRTEVRRLEVADRLRSAVELELRSLPPDTRDDVRIALEHLDPELSELVTLIHWDGFTLVEAAQLQGIPASTARGRYQRAKSVLRELLTASPC
ncbi:DNA-directed RNA polymerase sigma-70 factor [Luteimicrobium album]|uniref:DNA-directed RNA polymerase sigma-70 factor n=1 Tax=Luteimicrobium album TaxID=1054550 RepID=A0ABQ6HZC9_9MICO|nr:RNA polymerase sigma factor [Luteimicrobium album]GMA23757.1 DNA-directed RNA polymerase sigma-70 factor [Luteimicrobium album]